MVRAGCCGGVGDRCQNCPGWGSGPGWAVGALVGWVGDAVGVPQENG